MKQATITINGRLYDALSGSPIQKDQASLGQPAAPNKMVGDIARPVRTHSAEHPAAAIHSHPQRPQTLNRLALKKPQTTPQVVATRSSLINRFKPAVVSPVAHSAALKTAAPHSNVHPNTTPLHPSIVAAMQKRAAQQQETAPQSSKQLKEALIRERLAEVGTNHEAPKLGIFARKPKLASILVSSLSLLILGGYFTYINLTNISMRVAASNAGINASFPGYKPDGYSLNGPITYAPGEVDISYRSNTSDGNFTLTQKSSNWDSQGVLDNYVRKQTSTYLTFQQRGVTVYTFANKAAWTNGGLLYTIDGDANLSSDQILRLATSL